MDSSLQVLAFIEGLGGPEVMLIMVIILVLFGGEKLPGFARGAGKAIREFKKAASGVEEEFKRALEEDEHKASAPPPVPTTFPRHPPPPALTVAPAESGIADPVPTPAPKPAEPAAPEISQPSTPPTGPGPIDHLP